MVRGIQEPSDDHFRGIEDALLASKWQVIMIIRDEVEPQLGRLLIKPNIKDHAVVSMGLVKLLLPILKYLI